MVRQVLLPCKRLVAVAASVRGFPRVLADVICEMLLPRKRLVAVRTFVGRLASVLSHVVDWKRGIFIY